MRRRNFAPHILVQEARSSATSHHVLGYVVHPFHVVIGAREQRSRKNSQDIHYGTPCRAKAHKKIIIDKC